MFAASYLYKVQAYQTLKSLGHNGSKASLSRQFRYQKQVLGSTDLIGPMRPTCCHGNQTSLMITAKTHSCFKTGIKRTSFSI